MDFHGELDVIERGLEADREALNEIVARLAAIRQHSRARLASIAGVVAELSNDRDNELEGEGELRVLTILERVPFGGGGDPAS